MTGVAVLDLDLSAKNDAQLQEHGLPPAWRALAHRLRRAGVDVSFLNPGRSAVDEGVPRLAGGPFRILLLHLDNFLPPRLAAALGRLKAETPGLGIVACGYLATVEPAALLDRLPAVDAVVRGPLEAVLPGLARTLGEGGDLSRIPNYLPRAAVSEPGGLEYRKPVIDPGSLGDADPETAAGLFPAGVGILQGSSGCPCRCAFCRTGSFYRAYSRNPYALRAVGDLLREIEHLARQGIRHFKLYDNNFLGTPRLAPRRARELADGLRTLGLPLTFELHCRTDAVSAEVLEPLCSAGLLHLALGIESMAPSQLARFEKGETVEHHRQAARLVAGFGLLAQGYSILTDPLVTRSELAQSLAGLLELSDRILILIHERMILYRTSPYWARHGDALPGARTIPSSLDTVVDYELRDPWCRRWFPLAEEASQRFKRTLAGVLEQRLPRLTGPGLHRFVKAGTRLRLELLQRIVACDEPRPGEVQGWLAEAEGRIPEVLS